MYPFVIMSIKEASPFMILSNNENLSLGLFCHQLAAPGSLIYKGSEVLRSYTHRAPDPDHT